MSKISEKSHTVINFLIPFFLVCMFAVCALLVASGGLSVYMGINSNSDDTFSARTGIAYITTKLRQVDDASAVSVLPDHLIISETIDGEVYETHIFYKDGAIWECFVPRGSQLGGETKILDVGGLSLTMSENGMVSFVVVDSTGGRTASSVYVVGGEVTS